MERSYSDLLAGSLDASRLELLHLLAYHASMLQMPLYLVGGVVRDILLGRELRDFDLVVEGNSADFAQYIVKKFGGRVTIHSKFGTATWVLNESTFKRLSFPEFELPNLSFSFDFISARSEIYKHPGALPTVTRSTVDDDLRRRDFTINAMALRLDGDTFGELHDPVNGLKDLGAGLIRVLHEKSFIDDPTRIFRAIRYAGRYGFDIEHDTLGLINAESLAVLAQLSGERIRHEFDLMFEEAKPVVLAGILDELKLPEVIHPAMKMAQIVTLVALKEKPEEEVGDLAVPGMLSFRQALGWILYLIKLSEKDITEIGERLAFPVLLTRSVLAADTLLQDIASFKNWKPSRLTFYLDELPPLAVYAVWLLTFKESFRDYLVYGRNLKPYTTGYTLQQRGIAPGPNYKEILNRLRAAWLDGEVKTEQEENRLLERLLKKI